MSSPSSKAHEVGLIVMGTVIRTGIPGLLIRNTAETVPQQVRCSMLAVKPDTFASPATPDDSRSALEPMEFEGLLVTGSQGSHASTWMASCARRSDDTDASSELPLTLMRPDCPSDAAPCSH
jgi:hypothetical protein